MSDFNRNERGLFVRMPSRPQNIKRVTQMKTEQVISPVFSTSFDRKKASAKAPGRDEDIGSNRRLGDAPLTYFGVKTIVSMPGGRLKGASFISHNIEDDLDNHASEAGRETMKGDLKVDRQDGGNKRKGFDDDLLLQWGHRKRPRCVRVEAKHSTDESSMLSGKTIRVDRRVVKADKQLFVSQTQVGENSRAQSFRPCTPSVREAASGAVRRNGHDFTLSMNRVPRSNSCPSPVLRHFSSTTSERADQGFSASPEKHESLAVPPPNMDCGSPDANAGNTVENGGEAGHDLPLTPEKVDLDSFEWPRILISLSRKEKEDDFMAIKGSKLPQRPKRRAKVVEKALRYCTPGHWLNDLARGRYEVREKKSVKKKPQGLKAMESADSDSE